jgi:hypothetical protein
MIEKQSRAALMIAGIMAVSACTLDRAQTAAPAPKAAAADYQERSAGAPPAAAVRGNCFTAEEIGVYRGRMLQQEFTVATLSCQNPNGTRAYEQDYATFLSKFSADMVANARSFQALAGRKRLNVDVVVTEFANRTAQKVTTDREFCARNKRALDWALSPKVTTITQVPPPYDLGPDMNAYPCASP